MMEQALETVEYGGMTGKLYPDLDVQNPREEYGHMSVLIAEHRRYSLGDGNTEDYLGYDSAEFAERIRDYVKRHDTLPQDAMSVYERMLRLHLTMNLGEKVLAFEWLGLIDHSGISLYIGGGAHPMDGGGWDSGTIGFGYVTQRLVDEWDTDLGDDPQKRAREILVGEVEEHDQYLSGEVYVYVIEDSEGEIVDSLAGLFGADYAMSEMRLAMGLEEEG